LFRYNEDVYNMSRVYVCGSGGSGILLTGNLEDLSLPQAIQIEKSVKLVALGGEIAAGVCRDDRGIVWKMNQILEILPEVYVKKVAAGWNHVLVMSEERVWVMGKGAQGQLGLGNVKEVSQPNILNIDKPIDIACGFRTSFVVVPDGLYCFGENTKFQLGLEPKTHRKFPEKSPFFSSAVSLIASGNKHSAAYYNNTLYTWGNNRYGQLGISNPESCTPQAVSLPFNSIQSLCCGWHFTCFLTSTSDLYITGRGDMGQQGTGTDSHFYEFHKLLSGVDSVSAGSEHVLAIVASKAYSWGWNEHGNLGLGHTSNISIPTEVPLDSVASVWSGAAYSYFICS
jgi:alpha-tubulin suppressor-like RCC1 family protein